MLRRLARSGIDLGRVRFFRFPTDRVWVRDYGPLFVKDAAGTVAITDWRFNAWAKYDDWQRDDAVPAQVAQSLGLQRRQPDVGDEDVAALQDRFQPAQQRWS